MAAATDQHSRAQAAVVGDDGLARCPWAAQDPLLRDYHDHEWGVPAHDENALFERVSLEAFQSGLSWRTILGKREAFRTAFAAFDPERVAQFDAEDVERLMADATIIRNHAKILATITNAQAILDLRAHGGIDKLIWAHAPAPATTADVPARDAASTALAADLRAHGFAFVGPVTAYAAMAAIGVVNLHLVDCHRRTFAAAARA